MAGISLNATAAEPEAEFEFDGESLRSLLIENKVLLEGRVPAAESFFALALELRLLRSFIEELNLNREGLDQPRREAATALDTLRKLLPYLSSQLVLEHRFYGYAEPTNGVAQIEQLLLSIAGITNEAKLFAMSDFCVGEANIHSWRDYAPTIADKFRDLMQKVNPEKGPLANGHDGPVSRFLSAVIPRISGESPSTEAVSKYLQRKSRGDKRNS